MISPARQHFERISAAASQAAESESPRDANGYELMLHKLAQDKRRLSSLQSMERRADVKREILPEYAAWVEGVIAANQGVQDDVLMTIMVWRIDAGDFAGALTIARYAIQNKLTMPEQYARKTTCLLAEEFSEVALHDMAATELSVDELAGLSLILEAVVTLTEAEDMPDEVRAKLHKACGLAIAKTDKAAALEHLKRAFCLHEKIGVKKDIEKLERELKNLAAAQADDQ